jgi:hypothetical protein
MAQDELVRQEGTYLMSGAMREKDSADYDLERLTELFDEALTSDDPRVKNALRQLMMIVVLTSEDHEDRDKQRLTGRIGPMRRMQEDLRDLMRTVQDLKHEIQNLQKPPAWGGGYRAADNTSGMKAQEYGAAISAEDYWKSQAGQISQADLRDLNIKISSGLFEEK